MPDNFQYITLMASLPEMPPGFEVERVPISLPRLKGRLTMLTWRDQALVRRFMRFVGLENHRWDRKDEDVLLEYEEILGEMESPFVRDLVVQLADIRMLVAAVRRKLKNGTPPEIMVGKLADRIVHNWQKPQFGLGTRFPWLAELTGLLAENHVRAAERLLNSILWQKLYNLSQYHLFDFEALAVYLARWNIVHNWVTGRDRDEGRRRLDQLVEEAMGKYAGLFD